MKIEGSYLEIYSFKSIFCTDSTGELIFESSQGACLIANLVGVGACKDVFSN